MLLQHCPAWPPALAQRHVELVSIDRIHPNPVAPKLRRRQLNPKKPRWHKIGGDHVSPAALHSKNGAGMGLLDELRSQHSLYARCPNCEEEFRVSEGRLFDALKPLPPYAKAYLQDEHSGLEESAADLRRQRKEACERPGIIAESAGFGKVLEKIAPSLPGFPAVSSDCRALFEPIDYVVFNGLTATGRVKSLTFVDVKTGRSGLTSTQCEVRDLVECGKVRLIVDDHRASVTE